MSASCGKQPAHGEWQAASRETGRLAGGGSRDRRAQEEMMAVFQNPVDTARQ